MDETITYDVTDWVLSDHFWLRTMLEHLHVRTNEEAEILPELERELERQHQAQEWVILPIADSLVLSFGDLRRRFSEGRRKTREALGQLKQIPFPSKEFTECVRGLEHVLSDFAAFVEAEIVVPLRHCLSSDERLELGSRYADARNATTPRPDWATPGNQLRLAPQMVAHLSAS